MADRNYNPADRKSSLADTKYNLGDPVRIINPTVLKCSPEAKIVNQEVFLTVQTNDGKLIFLSESSVVPINKKVKKYQCSKCNFFFDSYLLSITHTCSFVDFRTTYEKSNDYHEPLVKQAKT